MRKSTGILMTMLGFLSGIILGFLFAPVKRGVYCGNYNGNVYGNDALTEDGENFRDEDNNLF